MCEFNVYDVYGIQECLDSYLKLVQWLPAIDVDEEVMKDERIAYAKHLIDKCEKVIQGEKIWSMKDE